VSCPECDGVKSRTRETGYDADGRRLRLKVCADCGTRYTTLEVTMPPEASLYVLAPLRKYRNRMAQRRKRGYQGGLGGAPLKPEPIIEVKVKVKAA
jgi:transcriptional regulator NrdR family protein